MYVVVVQRQSGSRIYGPLTMEEAEQFADVDRSREVDLVATTIVRLTEIDGAWPRMPVPADRAD